MKVKLLKCINKRENFPLSLGQYYLCFKFSHTNMYWVITNDGDFQPYLQERFK